MFPVNLGIVLSMFARRWRRLPGLMGKDRYKPTEIHLGSLMVWVLVWALGELALVELVLEELVLAQEMDPDVGMVRDLEDEALANLCLPHLQPIA